MQTKTSFTSGLDGRDIYFRHNVTFGCVADNVVEPGDIGNIEALEFCF